MPRGETEAPIDGAWRRRMRASWSWRAQFFGWIWFLVKGLPRHGAVVFVIYLAISIATSIASQWVQAPESHFIVGIPEDFDPRWGYFLSPTLALLVQYLPAMVLVAAANGHGWLADRKRRVPAQD